MRGEERRWMRVAGREGWKEGGRDGGREVTPPTFLLRSPTPHLSLRGTEMRVRVEGGRDGVREIGWWRYRGQGQPTQGSVAGSLQVL